MVLEGIDLACERGARELFSEVHFALDAGEALRVVGENGAGKTSLLRIVAGLVKPTRGEVKWRTNNEASQMRRGLVYIGHTNALKDDLDAVENLLSLCACSDIAVNKEAIIELLCEKGLSDRISTPISTLSQGQKRRVALARLEFCFNKSLWILDEPFSALDDKSLQLLKHQIVRYLSGGGSVIYTTHQSFEIFHHQHCSLDLMRFTSC